MDKTKANESQIDNLVDNIRLSQDNNSEQQTNFHKDPVAPATQDQDTPAARSHGNESPKLFQAKRQKRRQPIFREEPQNESEDSKKLRRLQSQDFVQQIAATLAVYKQQIAEDDKT